MEIGLLGSKSIAAVEKVLSAEFDNIVIHKFSSFSSFVHETTARTVKLDRLIVLQDIIEDTSDRTVSKLEDFYTYLCSNYSAIKLISLSKEARYKDLFSRTLLHPRMLHLTKEKIHASFLCELVSQDIVKLKEKYAVTHPSKSPPNPEGKKKEVVSSFFARFVRKKKELKDVQGTDTDVDSNDISDIDALDSVPSPKQEKVAEDIGELTPPTKNNIEDGLADGAEDTAPFVSDDYLQSANVDMGCYTSSDISKNDIEDEEDFVGGLDFNFLLEGEKERETCDGVDLKEANQGDTLSCQGKLEREEERLRKLYGASDYKIPENDVEALNIGFFKPEAPPLVDEQLTNDLEVDMSTLEEEYSNKVPKVKIVEKVVHVNSACKFYKNGVRSIILTGDRRAGTTRSALNIAYELSKESKVLYVDFDIKRKGSIMYLSLDDLVLEREGVQNGIGSFRTLEMLPQLVYRHEDSFDCLISLYGNDISTSVLEKVQLLLINQKEYEAVVIDCPLEYIKHLNAIIKYSEVLLCCENNKSGMLNLLMYLNECSVDDYTKTLLYSHSSYLVTRGGTTAEFNGALEELSSIFDLASSDYHWHELNIKGTSQDIPNLVLKL